MSNKKRTLKLKEMRTLTKLIRNKIRVVKFSDQKVKTNKQLLVTLIKIKQFLATLIKIK